MRILLAATYETGRQPFGLASPAAILRQAGHTVDCADTAVRALDADAVRGADLIAFHLPMHTATKLAIPLIRRVRTLQPKAAICCYGLYAELNAEHLRELGVEAILGAEFETGLLALANGAGPAEPDAIGRVAFVTPDRSTLPALDLYASLDRGGRRDTVGYTEASRGCKHLCRHCPVVPVYNGVFRAVPGGVVLADIRQQVESGARHISFGDPDFFNGPTHAIRIVEALHRDFPAASYDVTIKIEHLLRHRDLLPTLARTGCLFVTSAVESVDDAVLAKLDKGHTRAGFHEAVGACRDAGLAISPTFVAFTPWTTPATYRAMLRDIADLGLVENVAPVQLALRLLITAKSRLLELDDIRAIAREFDPAALVHPWKHSDPAMDDLAACTLAAAHRMQASGATRTQSFSAVWRMAHEGPAPDFHLPARAAIPYLTEPWYC